MESIVNKLKKRATKVPTSSRPLGRGKKGALISYITEHVINL